MAKKHNNNSALLYWSRVSTEPASSSIPKPSEFNRQSDSTSSSGQGSRDFQAASSLPFKSSTAISVGERSGEANVGSFATHSSLTSRNDSKAQTEGSEREGERNADSASEIPAAFDGFRQRFSQYSSLRPIVVVVGWMQSTQRQLAAYLRLINECGWDALACHPPLLHLWMPWRAEALARAVMSELEKELAGQPRPVVFLSFSGGYKACQWKIMEALLSAPFHQRQPYDGDTAAASALTSPGLASGLAHVNSTSRSHKVSPSSSHHRFLGLLRECFAGQIFDSSPVDFTSDLGVRFLSQQPATPQPTSTSQHPASPQQPATSQQPATPLPTSTSQQPATKASAPSTLSDTPVAAPAPTAAPAAPAAPAAISPPSTLRRTLVRSAATALDWLLLPEFERQRAAQWQSLLHSSVLAPVLLLCSTDDQLAPIAFIRKYAGEAEARGATVKAVEWSTSEHVGHLRHHRREYTAALHAFLERALLLWKQRQASSRGGGAGSDGGAAVAPRSRL